MKKDLERHEKAIEAHSGKNLETLYHDPLTLKGGSKWYMLAVWWFVGKFGRDTLVGQQSDQNSELLPLKYYNLESGGHWSTRHGWNLGCGRDIPDDARYHSKSLIMLRDAKIIPGIPRRGNKDPLRLKNVWGLLRKKQSPYYTKDEDPEVIHPAKTTNSVVP
jgi:hypothetical protein